MVENLKSFKNKQFTSFKLYSVLRSVLKSRAIPLSPAWDVNPPFVHCTPLKHINISISTDAFHGDKSCINV